MMRRRGARVDLGMGDAYVYIEYAARAWRVSGGDAYRRRRREVHRRVTRAKGRFYPDS